MARVSTTGTIRIPIVRGEPLPDWRFEALGIQPTEDHEFIERAYWHELKRYRALAPADPEAMRRLELVKEAYKSLCPSAAEPWTHTEGPLSQAWRERHRSEGLLDVLLVVLLLALLAGAIYLSMDDSIRSHAESVMKQVAGALQQIF